LGLAAKIEGKVQKKVGGAKQAPSCRRFLGFGVFRLSPTPNQRSAIVNRFIWLVGAVVIILFILGYFGLR